ncbi:MAG TPA: HPr(Ser) kinase/phosphatase [Clostridia bacterium]|nr:HPr(Ser) kinase/phosphatase [Clostridia bacterium]HPQ47234.1 HPr(Ser) kinase/phosphatase [Clostridia bacterium]
MYKVMITEFIKEFELEIIYASENINEKSVTLMEVNRPGLQLSGYLGYFFPERIQLMGNMEMSYLGTFDSKTRYEKLDNYMDEQMPCIVVARDLTVYEEIIEVAKVYKVPILRTQEVTSIFLSSAIRYLNRELAERISLHGELLEVFGEGILIQGESGVGKSETALELVKRGHRLIADDVVEIRKVGETTLLGTSPEDIRYFIELRGIGIIDVRSLYGVGSIKKYDNIDMVINLELWDENKRYSRLGVVDEYNEILGIPIPSLTIPVRPGRNLAIIVEVAAMNTRQKNMGYNAAQVLYDRIEKKFKGGDI